jgi:hypothetical protein
MQVAPQQAATLCRPKAWCVTSVLANTACMLTKTATTFRAGFCNRACHCQRRSTPLSTQHLHCTLHAADRESTWSPQWRVWHQHGENAQYPSRPTLLASSWQ